MAPIVAGIMAWIYSLFSNFFRILASGIHTSEIQRDGEVVQRDGVDIQRDGEEIQRDGEEIQHDGEELQSYLELIERILDHARQSASEGCSKPPQFYIGSCKYLAEKLMRAIDGAQSFLVPFIDGRCTEASSSSKDMARFLDACKQLYTSAELVRSFIQDCCKTSWTQAALGMVNVSEHISSICFDLEVCILVFSNVNGGDENMLSLMGIDELASREVKIVRQTMEDDKKALLKRVKALLQSNESSYTDCVIGKRLLAALKPSLDQEAYCDQDVGIVPQIGKLGKGAGGVVHRGIWYKSIDVAKKVIEGSKREMLIQAKLSHSNVTYLFCYGNEDGDHTKTTLLMDLMEGNLFDLIGKGMKGGRKYPFPILIAVDIMLQVGMGMQYAHESNIVHRDLKPQNIFSRPVKGTEFVLVKVGDFGSAKIVERDQTMTTMQGTLRYMAPEMLSFSHRKKDVEEKERYRNLEKPYSGVMKRNPFKCDIHSFAMLCFEILTGQQPFSEKQNLGDLILGGERPVLPEWCPEKLKDLIERCWSKDVDKRPSFEVICKELRYIKYLLLANDIPILAFIDADKVHWSELLEESLEDKKTTFLEAQELFEEILKQEEEERTKYNFSGPCFFQKMDDLVLGAKIGEGAEGSIYEVRGGLVVKVYELDCKSFFEYFDKGILTAFGSGFHLLSPLSLFKGGTLLTDSTNRGSYGIVMERKWGDLRTLYEWHMKRNQKRKENENRKEAPPFTADQYLAMMLGIAKDMKTLHNLSPPVLHRDLKCSNVLVQGPHLPSLVGGFEVTVFDYGFSGVVGSGFWRAPEILLCVKNRNFNDRVLTDKCDVYSYGMTCYELVTGRMPFDTLGGRKDFHIVIGGGRPILPDNLHTRIKDVIVSCWDGEPSKRPSFDDIVDSLSHIK